MDVGAKWSQSNSSAATAADLTQRFWRIKRAGIPSERADVWMWLWEYAGFQPKTICVIAAEVGIGVGKKERAAALSLHGLASDGLIDICPTKGREGGFRLFVHDPFEVLDAIGRRRPPSPQRELPFPEEPAEFKAQASAPSPALLFVGRDDSPIHYDVKAQASAPSPALLEGERDAQESPVVAAVVEDLPPALVPALQAKLGSEPYQLWLAGARIILTGDTLQVTVASEFLRLNVQRLCQADIAAVLAELRLDCRVEFGVDPALEPSAEIKAQANARSAALIAQETNKNLLLSDPFLGSLILKQTNKQTSNPEIDFQRPETWPSGWRLMLRASQVYKQIDDDTCFRWVAIVAAVGLHEQTLDEPAIAALLEAGDFAAGLKKKILREKLAVPWFPFVKTAVRNRNVPWQRSWETSPRQERKDQNRERRLPR